MYDLISDIHGYCSKLEELLTKLDYINTNGIWKHPERKAIFVGDYIDRGPEIRETLHLVKNMVEANAAIALMGNHEYNAVAYAKQLAGGDYVRSHTPEHTKQHQATIDQFKNHTAEWQLFLDWFYTLPLFLDLDTIRVVHACWDDSNIAWLKSNHYFTLNDELLISSHRKSEVAYKVIDETLKGKEFNIPEANAWYDKDGHIRSANRIKWWVKPGSSSYKEFLFNCPDSLMEEKVSSDLNINIYPIDAPPVFFGHYWLEDKFPVIQSANVICLDYSVAKNGGLTAYRWHGEKVLDNSNFVMIN